MRNHWHGANDAARVAAWARLRDRELALAGPECQGMSAGTPATTVGLGGWPNTRTDPGLGPPQDPPGGSAEVV